MISIDTYRDAFLRFLSEGMTHAEALDQFDASEWNKAVCAELEDSGTRIDTATLELVTNDSRSLPALLALTSVAIRENSNTRDFQKATELWMAGWTSESPSKTQIDVMSWYWRAPSKRPGKPGRRYLSTNQAFSAMKRAEAAR